MNCVNGYFNLNYSSRQKITVWDKWSVVYLENFMFGCTYFYLKTACVLTLPKICEIVPLRRLYYWTFSLLCKWENTHFKMRYLKHWWLWGVNNRFFGLHPESQSSRLKACWFMKDSNFGVRCLGGEKACAFPLLPRPKLNKPTLEKPEGLKRPLPYRAFPPWNT